MDPQPITLSGARIRLEPIGPRHAEDLYAAGKDEVIWRYLTTPPFRQAWRMPSSGSRCA